MSYREIREMVAYDSPFDILKKGAAALWNQRHVLLPQLAPLIDKGVSMAKEAIQMFHKEGMPQKIKEAVFSDHRAATDKIMSVIGSLN